MAGLVQIPIPQADSAGGHPARLIFDMCFCMKRPKEQPDIFSDKGSFPAS